MKKKFILSFLFTLILTSFVYAQNNCADSDGGLNYYTNGVAQGFDNVRGNYNISDVCMDGVTLGEMECIISENESVSRDYYQCPNGCVNGACVSAVQNQTQPVVATCEDSDGGKNVLVAGIVELSSGMGQGDYCDYISMGENKIQEAYCVNDTAYVTETMDCPSNKPYCNKGKCSVERPQCTENDGGRNPRVRGTTFPSRIADHTGSTDYCQITSTGQPPENEECSGSDCSLREFFCVDDHPDELYHDIPCPSGCKNGECQIDVESEDIVDSEGRTITEDVNRIESNTCDGCIIGENCYHFGYRKDGEYCSENKTFIPQLESDSICENNFECSSNVCVSGKCVDEGLIQRILSWFKKLFDRN